MVNKQKTENIRHDISKCKGNAILNFTKRTNELASCVSLYAQMRSSQKIQDLKIFCNYAKANSSFNAFTVDSNESLSYIL